MTIAQWLEERGMQKGIEKGIEEGMEIVAKRLLSEGTEIAFVAKITKLSLDRVKKLQKEPCN